MDIKHRPAAKHTNADALLHLVRRSCGRPDCLHCGEMTEQGGLPQALPGNESSHEPEEPELEHSVLMPACMRRQATREMETVPPKILEENIQSPPRYSLRPRKKRVDVEPSRAVADTNWQKRPTTPTSTSSRKPKRTFHRNETFESLKHRS